MWIETKLDLKALNSNVFVFEAITHYVGGLLSCYALTSEEIFLNKSLEIGLLMKPAFNTKTEGKWVRTYSNLFTHCRQLYISLVKSFIQSNFKNVQSIEMYKEALDAIDSVKMIEQSPGGHYYTRFYDISSNTYGQSMEYSGCYLGAMLSMGSKAIQRALDNSLDENIKSKELYRIYRHWQLAEKLAETCNVASILTRTGLGPYSFIFNTTHDAAIYGNGYNLSPELAESNFILWRLTHDPKYRDYAWEMTLALKRFCWIKSGGFSAIKDVDKIPAPKEDYQPPHFLSATLKYLYLTFTDDDVLPLDQWGFNAQGHPLPICGKNSVNPEENCKL